MAYLVLGLILFLGIHSISIVAPGWRDHAAARMGHAWRGIYSLVSIAGFVLIIRGYGIARQDTLLLYTPPIWTQYVTAVLMLPVFPLLFAPYFPGRIKGWVQHPMLMGVIFWSVAHLLATGTAADVVLFASTLVWSIADRISFTWRTQRPIQTAPPSKFNDVIAVVVGLVVYIVFVQWLHVRWIGVQPL